MAPGNKHDSPKSPLPSSSSTAVPEDATAVQIDGRTLEGGGQILRLSTVLSALTHHPVRISEIRGNRPKGGGLKPQHLTGVEWLSNACGAELLGSEVGSKELLLRPGKGGSWYTKDGSGVRDAKVVQSTPGAIGLVLQAVLPFIIFSNAEETVRLSITGGTHVPWSPSYEYIKHVFLPILHEKVGLQSIDAELAKHGWTHGRLCVGEVVFTIPPLERGRKLPGFEMKDRGDVERIEIFSRIPGATYRSLEYAVNKHVHAAFPALSAAGSIISHPLSDSEDDRRHYILFVAHTTNGYRIGYDVLYQKKVKDVTKVVEYIVSDCLRGLNRELERGGCVDEYLQDQLVVFQMLAEGSSVVDGGGGAGSLHTRTARWVGSEMLGVKWDGKGKCERGVGYAAGEGMKSEEVEKKEESGEEQGKEEEEIREGVEKLTV